MGGYLLLSILLWYSLPLLVVSEILDDFLTKLVYVGLDHAHLLLGLEVEVTVPRAILRLASGALLFV